EPLAPVTVVVAADLHVLAPELTDRGPLFQNLTGYSDGKVMDRIWELTDAFCAQMERLGPDVLILAGDLTFNGERASHEYLAARLEALRRAGVAVLVLPGNHDLENPMAASFHGADYMPTESVSPEDFAALYAPFGYDGALSRDGASLSYTARIAPGLRALLIDANTPAAPGTVTEETLAWAEEQLCQAAAVGDRVIAVSHQTVLPHSTLFVEGYAMEGRRALLELYERYGVVCALAGHMHIQHTAQSGGRVWELVTSALSVSPDQYGVLELEGREASYRTEAVEVPPSEGEPFDSWAADFFRRSAYRQILPELAGLEDAQAAADFWVEASAAYFAGRPDRIDWAAQPRVFRDHPAAFLSRYLQSIAAEGARDHTALTFSFS
ncbi:MAG: metallophosphoesterase, partial [Oscillibacter sp.]|nr:metallophosphoesterase [Oscillibacter sp.]